MPDIEQMDADGLMSLIANGSEAQQKEARYRLREAVALLQEVEAQILVDARNGCYTHNDLLLNLAHARLEAKPDAEDDR
jgi:hypothetical protein